MKKSTLLRGGIVVFVAVAAITLVYNYFLISPATRYAGVSKFGIKEIYPTKTGGEEWFINMVILNEKRRNKNRRQDKTRSYRR